MNGEQIKQSLRACIKDKCGDCALPCTNECQLVMFRDTLEYIKHLERLSESFEHQVKKYAQENYALGNRLKLMEEEMGSLRAETRLLSTSTANK